jgi:hypothetical protein
MKKLVKNGDLIPSFIENDDFDSKLIIRVLHKGIEEDT